MSFKTTVFIPLLCFCIFSISNLSQEMSVDHPGLSVMTYNLKFDDNDEIYGWDQRKEEVSNMIQFYEPAIIGTQEALLHQLEYLDNNLKNYKWTGVGRSDGATDGEFSALMYDSTRVTLIEGSEKTIWLSETPSEPSKGWDADFPRILTYGAFKNRLTDTTFYVFNTHFDHVGKTARAESAKLILNKISEVAGNKPVILTGDFNITFDSKPYATLTSETGLLDSFKESAIPPVGPVFTYEGFEVGNKTERRRIDYIFVNDKIIVEKYATISNFSGNSYPSDHLPVMVEINFQK